MTAVAFGPEILARGFTAIPNDVLVDLELSVQARMTWMLLAKYAWQKGQAFPAQATLGQLLGGVTARSVHRYVEELERGGWVEVQQRGLGKTNRYVLTFPASLTGHERPDGPDMDVCSDQTQVSDEERPTEKKTQEKKKRAGARILSPAEEPIGFSEWLGYHERLTGRKVPGASTTGRSELARTFARLLAEGHSLEDFKAVSDYGHLDPYWAPRDLSYAWHLRLAVFGERAESGRRLRAAAAAAPKETVDWSSYDS
jgi:hypothetical protein